MFEIDKHRIEASKAKLGYSRHVDILDAVAAVDETHIGKFHDTYNLKTNAAWE